MDERIEVLNRSILHTTSLMARQISSVSLAGVNFRSIDHHLNQKFGFAEQSGVVWHRNAHNRQKMSPLNSLNELNSSIIPIELSVATRNERDIVQPCSQCFSKEIEFEIKLIDTRSRIA